MILPLDDLGRRKLETREREADNSRVSAAAQLRRRGRVVDYNVKHDILGRRYRKVDSFAPLTENVRECDLSIHLEKYSFVGSKCAPRYLR
jgi:hypothetical protein